MDYVTLNSQWYQDTTFLIFSRFGYFANTVLTEFTQLKFNDGD